MHIEVLAPALGQSARFDLLLSTLSMGVFNAFGDLDIGFVKAQESTRMANKIHTCAILTCFISLALPAYI